MNKKDINTQNLLILLLIAVVGFSLFFLSYRIQRETFSKAGASSDRTLAKAVLTVNPMSELKYGGKILYDYKSGLENDLNLYTIKTQCKGNSGEIVFENTSIADTTPISISLNPLSSKFKNKISDSDYNKTETIKCQGELINKLNGESLSTVNFEIN